MKQRCLLVIFLLLCVGGTLAASPMSVSIGAEYATLHNSIEYGFLHAEASFTSWGVHLGSSYHFDDHWAVTLNGSLQAMTKEVITIGETQIPINMLKNDSHVLVFNALLGASYTYQILESLALGITLGPSAHIYLFNSPDHESQVYVLGAGANLYGTYMFNKHWGIQGGVGATLALYGKTVGDGQLQSGGNPATIPTVVRTHVNAVWNW